MEDKKGFQSGRIYRLLSVAVDNTADFDIRGDKSSFLGGF